MTPANLKIACRVLGLGAGLSFAAPAFAQAPVELTVTGISEIQGSVLAVLSTEETWSGRPVAAGQADVDGESVTLVLEAPEAGRYAIRLFHDRDGDGELDTNLLGIPTEPYGFSNDAPVRFGPPDFADAAFDVPAGGTSHSIRLQG